jgi:hypothetical protein
MPLLYFMHENISNRPDPKSTGRPRIYPLREILNAFPTLYLVSGRKLRPMRARQTAPYQGPGFAKRPT